MKKSWGGISKNTGQKKRWKRIGIFLKSDNIEEERSKKH